MKRCPCCRWDLAAAKEWDACPICGWSQATSKPTPQGKPRDSNGYHANANAWQRYRRPLEPTRPMARPGTWTAWTTAAILLMALVTFLAWLNQGPSN